MLDWLRHRKDKATPTTLIECLRDRNTAFPVSRQFGLDRGQPIDRFYIYKFLETHHHHIQGNVMEVGSNELTMKFGGDRVTQSHVLHAVEGNPSATLVGDLATGQGIPANQFDCILLTQVLHCIRDLPAALATCQRALKPGGCLLATFPGISHVSRYDMDRWGDFWRLTDRCARELLELTFGQDHVSVNQFGNARAAIAFLLGLAVEDIGEALLNENDPDYPVTITVVASA